MGSTVPAREWTYFVIQLIFKSRISSVILISGFLITVDEDVTADEVVEVVEADDEVAVELLLRDDDDGDEEAASVEAVRAFPLPAGSAST